VCVVLLSLCVGLAEGIRAKILGRAVIDDAIRDKRRVLVPADSDREERTTNE
jgi:hypothetical protein